MSEKEKALENVLYENGISCSTCKWWNENVKNQSLMGNLCTNEKLRQSGAYNGTLLAIPPFGKSMCSHWEEQPE